MANRFAGVQHHTKILVIGVLLLGSLFIGTTTQAADFCFTCEKGITGDIYEMEDKVTHIRQLLCSDCVKKPDRCFLCGLPVVKNFTRLSDGRTICNRDIKAVILDDREAASICQQVKTDLDRMLSRFLTLPDNNVTVQLMDRVKLQALYMMIGNDYSCPNTVGCTEPKFDGDQIRFEISLLSGQPKESLMTTCVHEYTHAWITENVTLARQKTLGKDAVEGFCELLSYLFAEQQGLTKGKADILANHYTRGQIQRFIAANQQYGLSDIVDWMKYGEDRLLMPDLSRVRRLTDQNAPRTTTSGAQAFIPTSSPNPAPVATPPKPPEKLLLQGIIWSKTRPMATINGRNFNLNDEATVTLASGPVTVRCMEIQPHTVAVQTNGAAELVRLEMK